MGEAIIAVIDDPAIAHFSVEMLFHFTRAKIDSVISPFSSSIFYLARLYGVTETKFYYNIDDAIAYEGVPAMYTNRWKELKHFIEKVFHSDRLIAIN